jgi:hypothetical protein
MLLQKLLLKMGGLDAKATTILSDMTPSSSGDTGPDMPRPILDCGPYANTVLSSTLLLSLSTPGRSS